MPTVVDNAHNLKLAMLLKRPEDVAKVFQSMNEGDRVKLLTETLISSFSPLEYADFKENVEVVNAVLKEIEKDLSAIITTLKDPDKSKFLHMVLQNAEKYNYPSLVASISSELKIKVYQNTPTKTTEEALFQAITNNDITVIKLIFEHANTPELKAKLLDAKDSQNRTPLDFAISSHQSDIIKILIREGKEAAKARVSTNNNSLLDAISDNDAKVVKLIFQNSTPEKIHKLLEGKTEANYTPLQQAMLIGNSAIVEKVIKAAGKDILMIPFPNKLTPLQYAIFKGNVELVKVILKAAGKDKMKLLNEANDYYTPIQLAMEGKQADIIYTILTTPSVDVTELCKTQHKGQTLLKWAKENKHDKIEQLVKLHTPAHQMLNTVGAKSTYHTLSSTLSSIFTAITESKYFPKIFIPDGIKNDVTSDKLRSTLDVLEVELKTSKVNSNDLKGTAEIITKHILKELTPNFEVGENKISPKAEQKVADAVHSILKTKQKNLHNEDRRDELIDKALKTAVKELRKIEVPKEVTTGKDR